MLRRSERLKAHTQNSSNVLSNSSIAPKRYWEKTSRLSGHAELSAGLRRPPLTKIKQCPSATPKSLRKENKGKTHLSSKNLGSLCIGIRRRISNPFSRQKTYNIVIFLLQTLATCLVSSIVSFYVSQVDYQSFTFLGKFASASLTPKSHSKDWTYPLVGSTKQLPFQQELKRQHLLKKTEKLQLDFQDMRAVLARNTDSLEQKFETVSNSLDRLKLSVESLQAWMKEREVLLLTSEGRRSHSGRSMADTMPNFALETQGARVVTDSIQPEPSSLFGFPIWPHSKGPYTVIQGQSELLPGQCWEFQGHQGTLVISLSHPVSITHVTIDHLPRYQSPTGRIDSAPKDIEVYGFEDDSDEGKLLGMFTYDQNREPTQTFSLPELSDTIYQFVELRILTNWGHELTCLYRFRVHGQMVSV